MECDLSSSDLSVLDCAAIRNDLSRGSAAGDIDAYSALALCLDDPELRVSANEILILAVESQLDFDRSVGIGLFRDTHCLDIADSHVLQRHVRSGAQAIHRGEIGDYCVFGRESTGPAANKKDC